MAERKAGSSEIHREREKLKAESGAGESGERVTRWCPEKRSPSVTLRVRGAHSTASWRVVASTPLRAWLALGEESPIVWPLTVARSILSET